MVTGDRKQRRQRVLLATGLQGLRVLGLELLQATHPGGGPRQD
jgi:hypothetical protein